jgi:hypothetical protein
MLPLRSLRLGEKTRCDTFGLAVSQYQKSGTSYAIKAELI